VARKSFLGENVANFSSFRRIADLKDPKDRMVQVVRWYLSVYHAGRKSAVAKKPYNPILGEIFQCHWDIPEYGGFESPWSFIN
jgi:Oxysterol-binding protein